MKRFVEKVDQAVQWQFLPELAQWAIDQALVIQQIPAPTFREEQRAAYVANQFAALGLQQIEIDSMYNVFGRLPGSSAQLPGVMLAAHMDTVFPAETDLSVHRVEELIYGPGLGDNSIGVAGLLSVARALRQPELPVPARDLWFAATTREEGLGDLGGMKSVFETLRARICCVINLEGLALGHIYHAGIAVRRLKIAATAPGGHSWLHFGRESAIHGLMQLGAQIAALKPAQTPRTTYNIGIIEGGHSINSIATHAALWLDLRSENREALAVLEDTVRSQVINAQYGELQFSIEVVGDRPAGAIAPEHPLVDGALAALRTVGLQGVLETGSTDGNIPLAAGYPAVTIGVTRGGNAHRLDEYIETRPVALGLHQILLLVLAAAHHQSI